ncbi:MAG: hypothetical protein GY754_21950 [bacterium]|nr:hypothetical protein [bacterium]
MSYNEAAGQFIDDFYSEAREWKLDFVNQRHFNKGELGRYCIEKTSKLRRAAIFEYLVNDDAVIFRSHLKESGELWLEYLKKSMYDAELADDPHYIAGNYEPLLDVIASGNFDLTKEIIKINPQSPREKCEHIGDFYYAQVLASLVTGEEDDIKEMVENFCLVEEKQLLTRQECTRALTIKDQDHFNKAFNNLLEEYEHEKGVNRAYEAEHFYESLDHDEEHEQDDLDEVDDLIEHGEKKIFVEGLALLQLANLRGLKISQEYPFCPEDTILKSGNRKGLFARHRSPLVKE